MAATAEQIARLRRMTSTVGSSQYSDTDLAGYIERYPLLDERGEEPYYWDESTQPPTNVEEPDWIPTYDLNSAAADVWDEIAAGLSGDFDFKVDGGDYARSQTFEHAMGRARYYRSRRAAGTIKLVQWPPESNELGWVVNAAE